MAYKIDVILDILKAIAFLDELSQFRIFKACIAYLTNTESKPLQGVEDAVFRTLIPRLQQEKEKESKLSLIRSNSGKKGGRKKANKANAFFASEKEAPLSSPSSSPSLSSPTPPSITLSTIPPIIPQETFLPPPHVGAHTHTYAGNQEEGYEAQYRKEAQWKEVAMMIHATEENAKNIFEEFCIEQKHNLTTHRDFSHFKSHFLNYARVRTEKLRQSKVKNGNDNRTRDNRGSAGVSAIEDICQPF